VPRGAYFKWQAAQRVPLDAQTYCPVTGPHAVTAALLDLTDSVSMSRPLDLLADFTLDVWLLARFSDRLGPAHLDSRAWECAVAGVLHRYRRQNQIRSLSTQLFC
jgi:hypothetical protein